MIPSRFRLLVGTSLAIACSAVPARSSVEEGLRISLEAAAQTVYPFEALPLKLAVTNVGAESVRVDDLPLHGEFAADFLEIATPSELRRKWNKVQAKLENVENGPDTRITLAPGKTHEFMLLLGAGGPERAPAFDSPGVYVLVIEFAGARSNGVSVECIPAPEQEREALERLRKLEKSQALNTYYDGRLLLGSHGKETVAEIERLAWLPGSRVYSNQAKLALADRAIVLAGVALQRDAARAPALFEDAQTLLEAIVPGSAIGHLADAESLVGRRFAQLKVARTPTKQPKH